jgi:hypothetical protein
MRKRVRIGVSAEVDFTQKHNTVRAETGKGEWAAMVDPCSTRLAVSLFLHTASAIAAPQ